MAFKIQSKTGANTSTTALALALNNDTTTGSTIVVAIIGNTSTDQISGITISSGSATFNKISTASGLIGGGAASYVSVWYAYNITGGTTPTITISKSATWAIQAIAWEISGLTTTDPLDKVAGAGGTTVNIDSGNTATTTQADEYLIGIGASDFGGATYTVGTNYTSLVQISAGAGDIAMQDRTVSATGAYNSTMTLSSVTDQRGIILTFFAPLPPPPVATISWLIA